MNPTDPVAHQGSEPPQSDEPLSQVEEMDQSGPPPSPQPKETPSDLGDLEPDVFFEVADLESLVPAQELRELLLTPDLLASPAKSSSGIPVQAESLLEPKSEMSSAESIAAIPLPLGPPPPGSSGAVAPYVESFGASSPQRTASVVSASSLSARRDAVAPTNKLENLPSFSFASVIARQQAAEAAQVVANQAPAPVPTAPAPSRRVSTSRLTVITNLNLPEFTPPDFTHRLFGCHPWASLVSLRDRSFPSRAEDLTSEINLELYGHIPSGGYLSTKFVKRLFPHVFRERPNRSRPLPIVELMRLDHAVHFRKTSQEIIDELLNGDYVATENTLPTTPEGSAPSVVLPELRPHFPVLYQVVNKGAGQGVVLEAKDFFIPGPDRRELHLIILDQFYKCAQRHAGFRQIASFCEGLRMGLFGPTHESSPTGSCHSPQAGTHP
ncbi:hypothetical protein V3C99_016388 [Haemonchus contortus]